MVRRDDLRTTDVRESEAPDLERGQVRLAVDKFGFSANNVTYAVFGEDMRYWDFFPASEGWGRVPVWGFADVVESESEALDEGARVFGYLPMSTHLVVEPAHVGEQGFVDASPHRAELPGAYQQYRLAPDPDREDERALLQPLYMTSMFIEDFLSDNGLFGAEQVVIASASSKTALGVAFLLSANRPEGCEVIGLTSPGNRGFCESTGYYDRVVPYGELATIARGVPTVLVDMAGDSELLRAVHEHFGEALRYSCIVGATHWEARGTQHELPGPAPQFFFAPTQMEKRRSDWGPGGIERRYGEAWAAFLPTVTEWMEVVHGRGPEEVERVYRQTLVGDVSPERGHMLSFSD